MEILLVFDVYAGCAAQSSGSSFTLVIVQAVLIAFTKGVVLFPQLVSKSSMEESI